VGAVTELSDSATRPTFDEVFEAHLAYVLHCLRRFGVQERDVDDVAQDVFVAVHRQFAEYDPARSAKAWLFSFAAQIAANHRRLARHRREVADDSIPESAAATRTDEPLQRAERLAWIVGVLDRMTSDRRNALIMHDMDGLTAPEIAAALRIPLNTVYSRVRRARDEFRSLAKEKETP
jgi:RNA polymerase sigma-70 factor (ECF subfamily)